MDIFKYFQSAQQKNLKPTLLEFTHPIKLTPLQVCGISPLSTLIVKDNQLWKDGDRIGAAVDIFQYLTRTPSTSFFPAYMGFFSYEFAEYLGKPYKKSARIFPEAIFKFYEQGLVLDNGDVHHHDPIDSSSLPDIASLKKRSVSTPITKEQFISTLHAIKEKIRTGDVYQVNFALPFYFDVEDTEMLSLYSTMRSNNKSPFMGAMQHEDFWLLSGSPERLFSLYEGKITTRPIAGTKKRKREAMLDDEQADELKACPKENAEHAMLVDLMRNDLNQVAKPGTVVVEEDRSIEFYSHVMHLVSEISGETTASLAEIFLALFPGGTITGAPKANAMSMLAELEAESRGPYTGSFGYCSGWGVDFNILIRSVFMHHKKAVINAGAGIVIDSDENSEWNEIHKKAQAIHDILQNRCAPHPSRAMIKGPRLFIEKPLFVKKARVVFIENQDSFSFNIIDVLRGLGAQVEIVQTGPFQLNEDITHVVIGPGPGHPEDLPVLRTAIQHTIDFCLPLLGICLGHQAIGHHFGAAIKKIPVPLHGKPEALFHSTQGLFADVPSPIIAVRYHSLAVSTAPENFIVDASTEDDCIMAIRHKSLPIFGLQFHPESYLSHGGIKLLHSFLRESYGPHR